MCYVLYLGADCALPEVAWNESARSFYTTAKPVVNASLRAHFSLPNVVEVGSHEGCGCGFLGADPKDPQEVLEQDKTCAALYKYLVQALDSGAKIEMYLCWNGEESTVPVGRKNVAADAFLKVPFPLEENEFCTVAR